MSHNTSIGEFLSVMASDLSQEKRNFKVAYIKNKTYEIYRYLGWGESIAEIFADKR
jgi:hypothetical protein